MNLRTSRILRKEILEFSVSYVLSLSLSLDILEQHIHAQDGGGVRGVVVCVILQALMRRFPTLLQEIDVIAGTSTGGMLAALLGSGCT